MLILDHVLSVCPGGVSVYVIVRRGDQGYYGIWKPEGPGLWRSECSEGVTKGPRVTKSCSNLGRQV